VSELRIRDWFGRKLITTQGIRGQVMKAVKQSEGLENRVIERLIDQYLVREERRRGVTWYELAHDRLMEPIIKNNEGWRPEHLQAFQLRAEAWAKYGESEDQLLRGTELKMAREWASAHPGELDDLHQRYLDASTIAEATAEREQQEQLQRELRSRLLPQALAAHAFVQLNAGEDERAALLARQAYLLNRERGVACSEQVLFDVLSAVCASSILTGHAKEVSSVAFSPDGQTLATGGYDGRICLWNLQQPWAPPRVLDTLQAEVRSLAFSHNIELPILAVGSSADAARTNTIRLYRVNESVAKPIGILPIRHTHWVTSLAFAPGSGAEILASGSSDQRIYGSLIINLPALENTRGGFGPWRFTPMAHWLRAFVTGPCGYGM
jgi:hypothetical protein